MAALYDRIGRSYVATRGEDPRIAAAIHDELGDARTVLNVGAGAGAYEPRNRDVTAVASFGGVQASFDAAKEALGATREEVVPIPHDCRDGFLMAYWRRPEAYLDPTVRANISVFALLPRAEVDAMVAELRADLESGAWERRNADVLARDEYDFGYRILVAE